jgi:hypothetical protein
LKGAVEQMPDLQRDQQEAEDQRAGLAAAA